MVAATQNPIEEEGTFVLGRAEQDRFVMKVLVDYPVAEHERDIIRLNVNNLEMPAITPVINAQGILDIRKAIFNMVKVSDDIVDRVQRVVACTRPGKTDIKAVNEYVDAADGGGASPRAGIHIIRTARAHAAISGRDYISPEDIGVVLLPVLRHRLILRPDLANISVKEQEALLHEITNGIFQRVWAQ
jgi:MoxR-like ATPase